MTIMTQRSQTALLQKAIMFALIAVVLAAVSGLYGEQITRKVRNLAYDASAGRW